MNTSNRSQPQSKRKIAFVLPWYGSDTRGGAEALARTTAEHLHEAGFQVEVWATTIQDLYSDWGKNYYRPGVDRANGVLVHRFPVKKNRNKVAFDAINWRLMQNLAITKEEEQIYISEMFHAPALYDHIRKHGQDYLLFFVTYMFASTYYGAQIYPERSIIIPCLHDEAYVRLSIYEPMFKRVRALVFNSWAEQELGRALIGQHDGQVWDVIGTGIDLDASGDADRFRQKYKLETPFVLYAGRRELGKNTPLLLEYWQRYIQEYGRDAKLVLIGVGTVPIPAAISSHVVDLGYVTTQDKLDAYAAASLLCQPSTNESFSIVVAESWRAGRPVLVHADCTVTVDFCRKANGGLYFSDYHEFAGAINYILDHPTVSQKMGQQGQQFTTNNFHWDVIVGKYSNLIYHLDGSALETSTSAINIKNK